MLYFLSGLTCDDQTFIVKSNAQRKAAEHGIALVVCDTSPRGLNIDGEDKDWDFGTGAGFYLNATEPKWKQYRMYDYVVKELPEVIKTLPGLDASKVPGQSAGNVIVLILQHHMSCWHLLYSPACLLQSYKHAAVMECRYCN